MKTLIGGFVALVLGVIGITVWRWEFLDLLAGAIPAMLVMGGALALYLGFDELKDTWQKDGSAAEVPGSEDTEKYKQEIDDLKKEIDSLKNEKA